MWHTWVISKKTLFEAKAFIIYEDSVGDHVWRLKYMRFV
jgi:hypothetical protein